MNDWTSKDFRKAAFAVGLGLTLGKLTGDIIESAFRGAVKVWIRHEAEKGDATAQRACRKCGIHYETKNDDEPTMKMGFC